MHAATQTQLPRRAQRAAAAASESSVAATAGALSATSPISILSPDALVRVLEHLGTDLLFVASVDHSFLRACEHCRVWRLVERSRRRSVGSYLRGCHLRLRLELSVVTDPRPSDRVRKDAEYWTNHLSSDPRPTDVEYRRKFLLASDVESFPAVIDLELPLWEFVHQRLAKHGPLMFTDRMRKAWHFDRPSALPAPLLGAKGYKCTLVHSTFVQCLSGRERRRSLFVPGSVLLPFSDLGLVAGESVDDDEAMWIGDDGFAGDLDDDEAQQLKALLADDLRNTTSLVDLDDFDLAPWLNIAYDFVGKRFCLDFEMSSEYLYSFTDEQSVTSLWWLLGHPVSAVALSPQSRRLNAAALARMLRQQA